ncbi:MAG: hemolysin family protein [Parvularculaceae bacterium]
MEGDGPKPTGNAAIEAAGLEAPARLKENDADEIEDGPAGGLFQRLVNFWSRAASNDDLAESLTAGEREAQGRLSRARREMIERVIAFDEKRVADVMAPRADIIAVEANSNLEALVRAFAEAGHSRLPIYRDDLDNPLGMAHIKDVVNLIAKPDEAAALEPPILKHLRREVLYAPPSMRVTDLLLKMQASRIHMALVIDEYGGTDGLVTIEDLVEEIVGDINDEHDDEAAPTIHMRPGGGWDVDARVELGEFADTTGVEFVADDDEVDTVGGLVVALAGRVPQRGEIISHPAGFDFEVTEADARKIRKLRIRRRADAVETSRSDAPI